MRELSHATEWHDPWLVIDHAVGLPALGWAPRAPTLQFRFAAPEVEISELADGIEDHNASIIRSTRPSGDAELDWAAWEKTKKEVEADPIVGPLCPSRKCHIKLFGFCAALAHGRSTEGQ